MDNTLFSVLLICGVVCCKGQDLSLHHGASPSPGVRKSCGVLKCTQVVNDRAGSSIQFSSVQRMSLFIRKDQRSVEVGSVTEIYPNFKSVANGKKTEGLLKPDRATMRLELVKEDDCMADFICEVHGLDDQGREVVSSVSLKQHFQQKQTASQTSDQVQLLNSILQKVDALEAKIENRFSKLEKDLEEKSESLDKKLYHKTLQLQENVNDKSDKSDLKITQLQNNLTGLIDIVENISEFEKKIQFAEDSRTSFEDEINTKIGRVEDKLDSYNKNGLSKLDKVDAKVSKVIAMFGNETEKDALGFMEALLKRSNDEQRDVFGNFTQSVQQSLNNASQLITSLKEDIDKYGQNGIQGLAALKNRTEALHDLLLSGNATFPRPENTSNNVTQRTFTEPISCYRNMENDFPNIDEANVLMFDATQNRDILCDTKTDEGGWIFIQRRTNGDVDFYRNWEDYKNGFGSPPGDFWLGNEAIHTLTSTAAYEIRLEMEVDGQNLFAQYTSFKIGNEADNYRLHLGSHSGTLMEDSTDWGFSYDNGVPFSTYDRDNDKWLSRSVAELRHGGWWYNYFCCSNLNGEWGVKNGHTGLYWYTGKDVLYGSKTEIKIRRL